jgi:signal transduction histidine kinase
MRVVDRGAQAQLSGGLKIRGRLLVSFLGLAAALLATTTWLIDRQARRSLEQELGMRLESIAAAATTQIDPSLIPAALSIGTEGGARVRARLRERLELLRDATGVRRVYILDREGRDQLDTDTNAVLGAELTQARAHRALLERVEREGPSSSPVFRDAEGGMRKTGYAPLRVPARGMVGSVGVEADARFLVEVAALRQRIALVAVAGFVLAGLLSVALARSLTRPIGDLVTAARMMGGGDLDRAIPVGRADEIGFLARTLEEARARLAERDRLLRAMVAGVAHEVRNPLGGIQIYTELLERDSGLNAAQRERVLKILREIHRLGEIVDEFLSYARPQAPVRVEFEPSSIVREAVDLLAGRASERAQHVEVRAPGGDLLVRADPGQLRQVLLNLVRNALDASPPGGKVRIAWDAQGPTVAFSVEDDGPGIPQEHREKVFEPFFTTKADGAGLGLSIVRHLTEQNGGRVSLERAHGGGCRFVLRLEGATAGGENV